METTFWGPSGWKFLHFTLSCYQFSPNKTIENEKIIKEFLDTIKSILPCKYCRISFTEFMSQLPIKYYITKNSQNNYLDMNSNMNSNHNNHNNTTNSRKKTITRWIYKMHNKVNAKLRKQGYCNHSDPKFSSIEKKYNNMILDFLHSNNNDNTSQSEMSLIFLKYVFEMGYEFLGSIVFNYQGYLSNCHTKEEKNKVNQIYYNFFNQLLPYIINAGNSIHPSITLTSLPMKTLNIREILTDSDTYSNLLKWFYTLQKNKLKIIKLSFDDYSHEFKKHIVSSCNIPIKNKTFIPAKMKTCRNINNITRSRKHTKKH